jgi:molybdopterin molybdotransferase
VLVVSAGSSVGARDETAAAIASLGEPGIWCHGLSLKPGKPTLLAEVEGIPVIGLPGNPRSALVVFRLIGMPIVRMVGGCTEPPPEPSVRARLTRDLPSAAGRLDVVQVRLAGEDAAPLFGSSSLLSILTAADGYLLVPEAATGLAAGSDVEVMLYR